MSSEWVLLHEYGSQVEADIAVGFLEDGGIPTRVEGPLIGAFGPGFSGATASGVRVFVPQERAAEAAQLLGNTDA